MIIATAFLKSPYRAVEGAGAGVYDGWRRDHSTVSSLRPAWPSVFRWLANWKTLTTRR